MIYLTTTLIFTLILLFCVYTRNCFNYWQKRNVPYIKPRPIVGNFGDIIFLKTTIGVFLQNVYENFDGPYVGSWIFHKPLLIVKDPRLIKNILIKDFKYFKDRRLCSDESADQIAANMLTMCKNPTWKYIRQATTPIFSTGKIKLMFNHVNRASIDFVEYIEKSFLNEPLKIPKDILQLYVAQGLINCVFGVAVNSFEDANDEFVKNAQLVGDFSSNIFRALSVLCYFIAPCVVETLKLKFFNPDIYKFLRHVVWNSIEQRKANAIKRNDLIDILMNMMDKRVIGDDFVFEGDRVVAQAFMFFAAGLETVSGTLSFALYELAMNPRVQEKLRSEIKNDVDNSDYVNYDNVTTIKYLNNFIKETLRKYPSLSFLDRVCDEDYQVPDSDLIIEKDVQIYIPVMGLHNDPEYFPNPHLFKPDRFEDAKIDENVYLPFGDGPRHCIGKRFGLLLLQVALVHICLNFKLSKTNGTPSKIEFEPKHFLLESSNPMNLRFGKLER